jgi:hypothetical protein
MLESINKIANSLFCHYDETDDAFLIGGLVEPNETLTASAIRHCILLVDFCPRPNQPFYVTKVINGMVNHEPDKISIYVIDVLYNGLCWRARHHTPRMATLTIDHLNEIEASYKGQPGTLPPIEYPVNLTMQTPFGTKDDFYIYSWEDRVEKSRCFDFGDFLNARDIEKSLGTDFGIIPYYSRNEKSKDLELIPTPGRLLRLSYPLLRGH